MAVELETRGMMFNEAKCVKCLTCYRVCPFDAISVTPTKVKLDIEKCQVCGICASACPAQVIEPAYYDNESLTEYIREKKEELGTDTLVVMCRGSTPQSCEILDLLKDNNVDKFVPLRVPCVGRMALGFYMEALLMGIHKIIVIQCDDASCRFKNGSDSNERNLWRFMELLKEIGHEGKVLTLIKNPPKAEYDTDKCVGCDKCEFVCPYDAIKAQPLATPIIDLETCKGCGACALVCPHLAIQLKGFEYEPSSQALQTTKAAAESKVKSAGPVVLVYCCQWAEFSALDNVEDCFINDNAVILEIPCANGLDPAQVLEAFRAGFQGVLVIECSEEDCKFKEGRHSAEGNLTALKKALRSLELLDRFEVQTSSPRFITDFNSKLEAFITRISALPTKSSGGEH